MNSNEFILIGEKNNKPYVKVWIDKCGNVRFSSLKAKVDGWNFMANMKVHGQLAQTGVEKRLKKHFKKLLERNETIPMAEIFKATTLLAKWLDKQRFVLGNEVMVVKNSDVNHECKIYRHYA